VPADLPKEDYVVTMVDDRTRVSREVIETLQASDLPVFSTPIPYRIGAEDQVASPGWPRLRRRTFLLGGTCF
jgi:hypothetical protein